MTKRVILVNKATGQELPEATLVHEEGIYLYVLFDGVDTDFDNEFPVDYWDYREVVIYRNGDILRRKDRLEGYVQYVYKTGGYDYADGWCRINASDPTPLVAALPGLTIEETGGSENA